MYRRRLVALLGTASGINILSGCADRVTNNLQVVIDRISVKNTSHDNAEVFLEIIEDEISKFTKTVYLSEQYGESTNVLIEEPVDGPGTYFVSAEYGNGHLEIDTTEYVSEDEYHVTILLRMISGGSLTEDVRTYSEDEITSPSRGAR